MITLNDTYKQTKKIVNAVNGTYQTVLTIDPSVGWSNIVGTYNCTVQNDRGESSETVDIPPGETWIHIFLLFIYTTVLDAHTPLYCTHTVLGLIPRSSVKNIYAGVVCTATTLS